MYPGAHFFSLMLLVVNAGRMFMQDSSVSSAPFLQCVLATDHDGQYLVKLVGEDYARTEWMKFPIDSKGVCHDPALALAIAGLQEGRGSVSQGTSLAHARTLRLP